MRDTTSGCMVAAAAAAGVDAHSNTVDGIIIIIIKKNPTDAITAEYMDLKCQNGDAALHQRVQAPRPSSRSNGCLFKMAAVGLKGRHKTPRSGGITRSKAAGPAC